MTLAEESISQEHIDEQEPLYRQAFYDWLAESEEHLKNPYASREQNDKWYQQFKIPREQMGKLTADYRKQYIMLDGPANEQKTRCKGVTVAGTAFKTIDTERTATLKPSSKVTKYSRNSSELIEELRRFPRKRMVLTERQALADKYGKTPQQISKALGHVREKAKASGETVGDARTGIRSAVAEGDADEESEDERPRKKLKKPAV